jgi:hypothetical protein
MAGDEQPFAVAYRTITPVDSRTGPGTAARPITELPFRERYGRRPGIPPYQGNGCSIASRGHWGAISPLALHLMGPPRVEVDGGLLEVDTRMAIALLAYLSVTAQPQSRDDLATLLWPEYDQVNARANLRRTLSALKRGLSGRWVIGERERIRLLRGALRRRSNRPTA